MQKKIHMLPPWGALAVKALIFNGVLSLLLLLSALVTGIKELTWVYLALYLLGNAAFFLYDRLLDRFLLWYLIKLRHRLKF